MRVNVQLVTYNGEKYIAPLLRSLAAQTYKNWELAVLDNGSEDNTVNTLLSGLIDFPVSCRLERSKNNDGYAGGHNALYDSSFEYFIVINQDMTLEPDCFEKLIGFLDQHRFSATVTPRVMSMDDPSAIDSLGLAVERSGKVSDAAQGKKYSAELLEKCKAVKISEFCDANEGYRYAEVFGVSGALFAGRTKAIGERLFSENYFAYKEDVDLAWRTRLEGWKNHVHLDAVAFHDRTAGHAAWFSKSEFIRFHSYRNHLRTILKNTPFSCAIFWYELKKFVFLLAKDRATLAFAYDDRAMLRSAYKQRQNQKRRISNLEIKQWLM